MQVEKVQLERQQLILKVLGFYQGHLDGVWGPISIAAKKKFEADKRFVPGMPNNGMPFREGQTYPAGMTLGKDDLFYHPAIDPHIKPTVPTSTPPGAEPDMSDEELEKATEPDAGDDDEDEDDA